MFMTIRLIIGSIFLLCSVVSIKKFAVVPVRKWYALFVGIAFLMIVALAFFPFENYFVTFDSPEAAYEYYHGEADIALVVEGNASDYVIERKNENSYQYSLIPKTTDGWKIGTGSNIKCVVNKCLDDGTVITVERYKNSGDYFIRIRDAEGEELTITDSFNTKFHLLEGYISYLERKDVAYYAYIPNFNEQYSIVVNGNKIPLGN